MQSKIAHEEKHYLTIMSNFKNKCNDIQYKGTAKLIYYISKLKNNIVSSNGWTSFIW